MDLEEIVLENELTSPMV